MTDQERRARPAQFLRRRLERIARQAVGLPRGTRRRTPGLRREELATLAGVGVTWYTWLEQGRDIRPSAQTLERISRALHLTPTDTTYLFALAGIARGSAGRGSSARVEAFLHCLVDVFEEGPALLTKFSFDTEAFNPLTARVFRFFRSPGVYGNNMIWKIFMEPMSRSLFCDRQMLTERVVGMLRL